MFTVSDLVQAVGQCGSGAAPSDLALCMALMHEDAPLPWPIRYQQLIASDDYDEVLRLTDLAETHAPDEPPPLYFDGAPADLTAYTASRPKLLACAGYEMPAPPVRHVIDAETKDPTWGIMFSYHLIQAGTGLEQEAMLAMPQQVFAQLEEGLAFLLRGLAIRTIAKRL